MSFPLYMDEDGMDRSLVKALREHGVDLVTALEAGLINRPDDVHLAHAAADGRVLYSYNVRDYHRLHAAAMAAGPMHAGIVLAPQQRYSVGEEIRRLLVLLRERNAEQMIGQLEFLSAWG